MQKKPSQIWGIWIRENRTFYYLETGAVPVTFNGDKIRSTLISRGILKLNPQFKLVKNEEPYLQMTLRQAQDKEYKIEKFYLNKHIEASVKAREAEQTKKANPWE